VVQISKETTQRLKKCLSDMSRYTTATYYGQMEVYNFASFDVDQKGKLRHP